MEKKEIATVDEYIAQFPEERAALLAKVRESIRKSVPAAEERISWAMPTYWQGENLVHFASGKNHIGFYPAPEAILAFAQELSPYKTSKGAIQFPVSQPIPYELIETITRWRVAQAEEKRGEGQLAKE